MTLYLSRTAVLDLKSFSKFPGAPYLIAPGTDKVRGILLGPAHMLTVMHCQKHVCPIFLDGLPTVNRSSIVPDDNCILRVERGQGGGIFVVQCLTKYFCEREKLLA